ncbi:urease accessory protein UreF [Acaryochloris thomasi]|uniref:urease accessory protein UreF n=1 Tax=Acaryochloris thomasi TaxID=2929456 RepID=UPI000DA6B323|nr:urease accessory protein UreF [Acaryochloris thomasi]
MTREHSLLRLLQLASPALPVGAYSYSEGLEGVIHDQVVSCKADLASWLVQELTYGSIHLEAAILVRSYCATANQQWDQLQYWNAWLTAARETEELRSQSLQMGQSLLRLFRDIELGCEESLRPFDVDLLQQLKQEGCNFAVIFGLAAAHWQIESVDALLGYLQSWATNLINAGIKLIPIGQTAGQLMLFQLQPTLEQAAQNILNLEDDDLKSCGWGLALASMAHETQYSRLFRS